MVKKNRKVYYIITFTLVFLLLFFYWQNHTLQISRYELTYDNLPKSFDGYKIVQISDMHGKTFGKENKRLANKIKSLKPDILLITGDMMSSTIYDEGAFLEFLDHFNQTCPVYMCLGNHEQIARYLTHDGDENTRYSNFINNITEKGVILLDNRMRTINNGTDSITISGLTLELYHYSRRDLDSYDENMSLTVPYIEEVLSESPKHFNMLLAHNPVYFEEYVSWGTDLVFTGHIHGGIIRIPFLGGVFSPERVLFPEYDSGLFQIGDSRMIVNRGLGYSKVNLRLFNRPEISFIRLMKK
ncbi:MAG: metallophosphoesterase [Clostridiaceae bacterium]|nr:metallophosphoesterase [Clostridiaceae bacterium]